MLFRKDYEESRHDWLISNWHRIAEIYGVKWANAFYRENIANSERAQVFSLDNLDANAKKIGMNDFSSDEEWRYENEHDSSLDNFCKNEKKTNMLVNLWLPPF